MSLIETTADTLAQASHFIKALHALAKILRKHILPLCQLLLVVDLEDALIELGAAADAPASTTDRVWLFFRHEFITALNCMHDDLVIVNDLYAIKDLLLRVNSYGAGNDLYIELIHGGLI